MVESRASIEQANGALMLVYGISTEQAFNLLRWRSQQTNTKLRALAKQLVAEFHTLAASEALRSEFDHPCISASRRPHAITGPLQMRWMSASRFR